MLIFWLGRGCVRRAVLAAVLLLAAAAWFGWPSRAAAPADVTISGFAFAPATLTVARGTTVTWINQDDEPHTVASADEPRRFKSGALDTGDRFSFTFDAPGTYKYFCTIHPHMQGTVVVK